MKRIALVLVLLQIIIWAPRPAYAYGGAELCGDIATYFYLLNKRCDKAAIPRTRLVVGGPHGMKTSPVSQPVLKLKVGASKS